MTNVTATGEIPIDLTQTGVSQDGTGSFSANHTAALTCSRSGAIPAMPSLEELADYLP